MLLRDLRLHHFRAHEDTTLSFAPGVNLLYGPNGAGKTNVLEALHYLCLTKSFLVSQDTYALREGAPYFEVEGTFEGERRPELRVRLAYVPGEGKRLFVNRAPLERLSEIVGVLPVVIVSPEDAALTAGGPDERRRFLDNIMSQARPVHLDDLMKYRRALKQRNEVLYSYRRGRASSGMDAVLASWTAELVALGSRIILARARFLASFAAYLEDAYRLMEDVAERPTIGYDAPVAVAPEDEAEAVAERYGERLREVGRREREVGRTLAGPHLDELVFRLDEREVRRYASQGQHRTFGMALKLAKYFYLRDRVGEAPLLLLDDVFGSLDPRRTGGILGLLASDAVGQSIVTATERAPFEAHVRFDGAEHRALLVVGAEVGGEVDGEEGAHAAVPNGAASGAAATGAAAEGGG